MASAWEADGLRPLEWSVSGEQVQILFSTRPDIQPDGIAARAKGRLQHALRREGHPAEFQRNFSLQTVGAPHSGDVETYLRDQLQHGDFADPRYRNALADLAFTDPTVSLVDARNSKSGRYVLAYHLVFVTSGRCRMPWAIAVKVQEAFREVSEASDWKIAKFSLMPDHAHIAVRGVSGLSPLGIGERMREATSRKVGTFGFWMPTWYMGSFGKYGMGAVRARQQLSE
ncbi:MAG: transposase [Verrucomicrobia bacterium]|nr:transposase [Verrucomicrobiota bacterium]MCH8512207.1 transposase [Kiritimatiellia bacterium]